MYPQRPGDHLKLQRTESPRLRRAWASRARRRLYTTLYLALILTGAVLLVYTDLVANIPEGTGIGVSVAFLVVLLGAMFLSIQMNRATRTALPYRLLDERQRADRDTAFRVSQQVMAVFLVVLFGAVAIVPVYSPPSMEFPSWLATPLLWVVVMFHVSAPACYLAWTQPDEVLDEDELAEG